MGIVRDLDSWSYSFTEEVFEYWQENFPEHEKGVKTFHSPVRENPEFLILSFNPGYSEGDGEEDLEKYHNEDFHPPESHEFTERDYPMAERARKLFANNLDKLEKSVMHDLIFFRSNDISELEEALGEEQFSQVEDFCTEKVRESIEKIDPEKILLLGISDTRKLFKRKIAPEYEKEQEIYKNELTESNSNRRSIIKGRWKDKEVYTIVHLSGGFGVSDEELRAIEDKIM